MEIGPMYDFRHFSAEVNAIALWHNNLLMRLAHRVEYWERRYFSNEPMPFPVVDNDEGEKVGETIEIRHLRMHDMMEHEARGQLTKRLLLNGLRANAFSIVRSISLNVQTETTIQPRWIQT
jgi:hypothetical protein